MSDDDTHFQFQLGEIQLEIMGERSFVEEMYRKIMNDIETARKRPPGPGLGAPISEASDDEAEQRRKAVLWVHRCSEMMHKIYMSSPEEIDRSPLMRCFETLSISVIYADKDLVTRVLPKADEGQTLWAELTEKGRKRIAQASSVEG